MLLNNEFVNHNIKGEIKRYIKANENQDIKFQNLWDTGKAILRGKFIALQVNLKKKKTNKQTKKAQRNNLTIHLKELEKEQQTKPKVSRRKKIIQIKPQINEIEPKGMIQKINESNR